MSRGNKWVPIDKYLSQEFRHINRPFSRIEAMFSYTLDSDCGRKGTINGYAKLWQWSRDRVRKFVNEIRQESGHQSVTRSSIIRHPIHYIDKGLWAESITNPTRIKHESDTNPDTTTNPNPKPNKTTKKKTSSYTEQFEEFWKEYPNKKGKYKAFLSWKKNDFSNGLFEEILESLQRHKESAQWLRDDGKYIPHGVTWVNGKCWEDGTDPIVENKIGGYKFD